jgi:hypothetical protein
MPPLLAFRRPPPLRVPPAAPPRASRPHPPVYKVAEESRGHATRPHDGLAFSCSCLPLYTHRPSRVLRRPMPIVRPRGRAEPETLAERDWVRPLPRPHGEPRGRQPDHESAVPAALRGPAPPKDCSQHEWAQTPVWALIKAPSVKHHFSTDWYNRGPDSVASTYARFARQMTVRLSGECRNWQTSMT